MNDPVLGLYAERRYPDLSHPVTDPSTLWVSARVAGLEGLPRPAEARVLEAGCAAGQNLLPLAARYPAGDFLGLDAAAAAIGRAREAASAAGLERNARFEVADLATWRPAGPCDYLLAHGVFSWVPDAVKERLLDLAAQVLSPSGVMALSYNTLPGWSLRRDVVPLVEALARSEAGRELGGEAIAVAASLAEMAGSATPYAAHLQAACREMVRKGPQVLPFDDFAPVCDAVYFSELAKWAAARGLRYLGEARLEDDMPEGLEPGALSRLSALSGNPALLQQAVDLLSGRTHRTSLFCRTDAPRAGGVTMAVVLEFAAMGGRGPLPPADGAAVEAFRAVLAARAPACVAVPELLEAAAAHRGGGWDAARDPRAVARWLFRAARAGAVELRSEPLAAGGDSRAMPRISALNRHFAAAGRPMVDARHRTCRYPDHHERLLVAMDGSRTAAELRAWAEGECPDLDFDRWLEHLAERGIVT